MKAQNNLSPPTGAGMNILYSPGPFILIHIWKKHPCPELQWLVDLVEEKENDDGKITSILLYVEYLEETIQRLENEIVEYREEIVCLESQILETNERQ